MSTAAKELEKLQSPDLRGLTPMLRLQRDIVAILRSQPEKMAKETVIWDLLGKKNVTQTKLREALHQLVRHARLGYTDEGQWHLLMKRGPVAYDWEINMVHHPSQKQFAQSVLDVLANGPDTGMDLRQISTVLGTPDFNQDLLNHISQVIWAHVEAGVIERSQPSGGFRLVQPKQHR
jgi:hypothetical protein